jgi:hypothetical protein
MDIISKINVIIKEKAFLIDIFPKTVPQKDDNRYFAVEKYFHINRSDFDHGLTSVILKLYCYFDFIIITHDSIVLSPKTDDILSIFEKCFRNELDSVNILLPEHDTLLSLYSDDLYMTVYNAKNEVHELISQLVRSEGLFFYESPEH